MLYMSLSDGLSILRDAKSVLNKLGIDENESVIDSVFESDSFKIAIDKKVQFENCNFKKDFIDFEIQTIDFGLDYMCINFHVCFMNMYSLPDNEYFKYVEFDETIEFNTLYDFNKEHFQNKVFDFLDNYLYDFYSDIE